MSKTREISGFVIAVIGHFSRELFNVMVKRGALGLGMGYHHYNKLSAPCDVVVLHGIKTD